MPDRTGVNELTGGTGVQDWLVEPGEPVSWWLQAETASSGVLGDVSAHSIDLAQYRWGQLVSRACAATDFADGLQTVQTSRGSAAAEGGWEGVSG